MLDDQAINLSSGKEIKRHMVYKSQPRRVFSSSRPAYAISLVADIRYFLWMRYVWSKDLPTV